MDDIEKLAQLLHEADREANKQLLSTECPPWWKLSFGWEDIHDKMREVRRIQARYLLSHGVSLTSHEV